MININIGIDIGGNHVGIGVVDDSGEIIKKKIIDYNRDTITPTDIFKIINTFLNENKGVDIETIGIGIPGISTETHIDYTCNLPLTDVEIYDYVKTRVPIYVSNDANCATIAEYEVIDKKFYSNYALVTVGTGIGAGLILNGQLYSGTTGSAGEIGHMVIEKDGLPCRCGRRGCFEQYASVSALKRLTETDELEEIFYLSERNMSIQNVLGEYIKNLSVGMSNIINMYDVEVLVIGGSLAQYGDKFLSKLKSLIMSNIYNQYTYDLNIKTAKLRK